jgi:hypothetical protein
MSIDWIEDTTSRSATIFRLGRRDASIRSRVWNIVGSTNEDVIHADINSRISNLYQYWTYPGQPLVRLRAESYSLEHDADDLWKVIVNYEKLGADDPTQSGPLKRVRSFDTTGGTQTVTQGRGPANGESVYGPSGLLAGQNAPSMYGAVNVDDRGVNGVDIVVPQMTWTESYDVPSTYVTNAYVRAVHLLTGTINAAPFRGFARGEVLFLGMTGQQEWDAQRGDGPWSLAYKFSATPNRGSPTFHDTNGGGGLPPEPIGEITTYNKFGQDFLWVKYATQDDQNNNIVIRKPLFVYVNKVYPDGDFSKIGIGVA